MSLDGARQRVDPWMAPLPGDNPCGLDARYDEAHEAVRTEMAKLGSPAAGEVRWNEVVQRGGELLAQRSKDLLIAAYTAQGLYEEEGLSGLLAGVVLLNGLLESSWDGLYPGINRLKARAGAVQWFVERASLGLQSQAIEPGERPLVLALVEQIDLLAAAVRSRFGDQAPALGPLVDAVAQQRLGLPDDGGAAQASTPNPAQAGAPTLDTEPTPDRERAQTSADEPAQLPPIQAEIDPSEEVRQRVALWLAPISEAEGAGEDARYDRSHEQLRATIQQLDSPTGHPVDWAEVVQVGQALLLDRSKDLLIGSYVAMGLFKEQGLDGLVVGLGVQAGLMESHWDGLFPSQRRGNKARAAALAWLLSRLDQLAELPLVSDDRAGVERLAAAADWLVEQVNVRFEDDHRPAVRPLLEQIERLRLAVPEPAATPSTAGAAGLSPAEQVRVSTSATTSGPATAGGGAAVDVPSSAAAPTQVENRGDINRFLSDVADSLRQTAAALRQVDLKDPLGYLLPRIATALEVDEPPPSEQGRTLLPSPDPYELKELRGMLDEQNWEALLEAAEGAARISPLFLDLQRFVHTALTQLGGQYDGARLAVESELGSLVHRMPELPELVFSDGTPMADPDTQAWLSGLTASGTDGGTDGADSLSEPLQEARALAVGGNKSQALDAFQALLSAAGGGRGRFRVRLAMAEALRSSGETALAVGLYGSLYTELEARELDEWEPELAARCISGYHECLPLAAADGLNVAHEPGVVYARLCRVDPRRVLKSPR